MSQTDKTLNEFVNGKPERKVKWSAFVESDVVNFFNLNNLERMTVEDGSGNKAKLTRQKDNGIKAEYSSITVL